MHEYSMTTQIVEAVHEEAEKHTAKKVKEVHLIIGKLTFLGLDQVRFSYDLLVKGTIMEGSKLRIDESEAVVHCSECGYRGPIKYENVPASHITFPTLHCPICDGVVKIVEGRECTIKSVKLVV